ncbi:MoaD/ThiS family protein [Wukongibacter baidiensis]|uniref:MoaD/ThiS family protein n=1 Tax=Wukongibacter baidiensis TaxID=1723361 RepID=UPI003D7F8459
MITIKFNSILKRLNNNKEISELEFKENYKVKDILKMYKVIPGEVGIILLNSDLAAEEDDVRDGDVIEIFPIFGGG